MEHVVATHRRKLAGDSGENHRVFVNGQFNTVIQRGYNFCLGYCLGDSKEKRCYEPNITIAN